MVEAFAASLYLLNKIFFLLRELAGMRGDESAVRKWKIAAWTSGLAGLPFVTWILLSEHDWIFGLFEQGVAPSMVLGLVVAIRRIEQVVPRWVDRIVYAAICAGVAASYFDLGGLASINQGLELTAVGTFHPGSYLLAKDKRSGYLWYVVMFAAAGTLLVRQEHYMFALQQAASAFIIMSAYVIAGRRKH